MTARHTGLIEACVIPLLIAHLLLSPIGAESAQRSDLTTWNRAFKTFADIFANMLGSTRLPFEMDSRRQDIVPIGRSFPCQVPRFKNPLRPAPTSVHRLRPQDIDVIATLGDSLVEGFGAMSQSVGRLFHLYPEISWAIGGAENWRSVTTIPNLIRVFNPNLIGFALEGTNTHFGMGVSQAHDEHLLEQAKRLVKKIKNDPRVDFERHWKMLTIVIGHNDVCSGAPCFPSPELAGAEHAENIRKALDYLQANMPRTFVNVLPMLDVTSNWKVEKSLTCGALAIYECDCLYGWDSIGKYNKLKKIVHAYHSALEKLIDSGRYDTNEDFTAVFQPFSKFPNIFTPRNFLGLELTDLSVLALDCFHLSQKGHAIFATMQWNNMFQPEGNKSLGLLLPLQNLLCPTKKAPYFFTRINSKTYFETGNQRQQWFNFENKFRT